MRKNVRVACTESIVYIVAIVTVPLVTESRENAIVLLVGLAWHVKKNVMKACMDQTARRNVRAKTVCHVTRSQESATAGQDTGAITVKKNVMKDSMEQTV